MVTDTNLSNSSNHLEPVTQVSIYSDCRPAVLIHDDNITDKTIIKNYNKNLKYPLFVSVYTLSAFLHVLCIPAFWLSAYF